MRGCKNCGIAKIASARLHGKVDGGAPACPFEQKAGGHRQVGQVGRVEQSRSCRLAHVLRRFISAKRRAQRRALGARQAQQRRVAVQALLHNGVRSRVFRKELAPAPARKVLFRHTPPNVQLLFHVAENVAQLEIFLRQRLQ